MSNQRFDASLGNCAAKNAHNNNNNSNNNNNNNNYYYYYNSGVRSAIIFLDQNGSTICSLIAVTKDGLYKSFRINFHPQILKKSFNQKQYIEIYNTNLNLPELGFLHKL
jgi:hypothetical protein